MGLCFDRVKASLYHRSFVTGSFVTGSFVTGSFVTELIYLNGIITG